MILGFDLGYLQSKGYTLNEIFKFLSIVGTPSAFELKQYKKQEDPLKDLIVTIKDKTYYVGEKALETANPTICIKTDKLTTDQEKAENYAALGYLYKKTGETEFNIVTGLPVHDFKLAEQLTNNMKGTKEFLYGEDREQVKVKVSKVLVIPQSAGAYFSYILDDEGKIIKALAHVALGTTIVIDIGYKTTDIITMKNGKYKSTYSDTSEFGMRDIHMELIRKIRDTLDTKVTFTEIDSICRNKYININGEKHDISNLILESEAPIARAIINDVAMIVPNIRRIETILCCGGTMSLLYPYFEKEYSGHKNIIKIENPEYANASGYYRYGMMMFGNKNKSKA